LFYAPEKPGRLQFLKESLKEIGEPYLPNWNGNSKPGKSTGKGFNLHHLCSIGHREDHAGEKGDGSIALPSLLCLLHHTASQGQ
ncbi:MAG: hypothetical protein Q8N70_02165, partial [Deltaproteobacteria bacterium]|nr:hypothetical protein [Deltaproteobacteria bacterium]